MANHRALVVHDQVYMLVDDEGGSTFYHMLLRARARKAKIGGRIYMIDTTRAKEIQ